MGKKIKITLGSRAPKGSKSVKSSKAFRNAVAKRPSKGPKKPVPQQRRDSTSSLSSAPNLSDEDGYSAVEDVPDSDDDEDEHVFAAEMEHILSHQQQRTAHSSPRPAHDSDDSDDSDEAVDHGATDDGSEDDMADEESVMEDDLEDGSSESGDNVLSSVESVALGMATEERTDQPPARHVRFTGVPDTDSEFETEDDHDDVFPDIFVPQSTLDPSFRREIEYDDNDADSYSSDTYWDYSGYNDVITFDNDNDNEEDNMRGLPFDQLNGDSALQTSEGRPGHDPNNLIDNDEPISATAVAPADDDDESSDGYETDGETTEEDEPVLIPRRHTTPEPPVQGNAGPADKGKSPAGRLLISSRKKPICIVNPVTRKMMIIRPQKRARLQLPPGLPVLWNWAPIIGNFAPSQSSPIKDNGVMWSEPLPFNNNLPLDDVQFDEFINFAANQDYPDSVEEQSYDDMEEEDDGEKDLNIEDFIDMNNLNDLCAPDDETSGEGDVNGAEMPSRRPSTISNGLSGSGLHDHPLLKHLQAIDCVGAFRINQDNQKLIANGVATKESLGFSNPLFHGTLRGIKQGNLQGAATPLTPERRHKKAVAKSPLEMNKMKRKASDADDTTHKRQRSISDVMSMAN